MSSRQLNKKERLVHVVQGQYHVDDAEDAVISTVLGSCVAACIFDPIMRIGGMNHFLLPGTGANSGSMTYGAYAMELLINDLLKRGCARERLEAKVFGGARMMDGLSDIGAKNADFVHEYLYRENITIISESLGGERARRIRFWPTTGRVRQLILGKDEMPELKTRVDRQSAPPPVVSDLELF